MKQHTAALDMAKEPVAKAGALMRTFDQPGNVGHHEFTFIHADHTQIGMKRGERVIGDFRPRRRHRGKESGFAGIRHAEQSGIGDQLQPQPDPHFLSGLAGLRFARGAVRRGFEKGVALAAGPALGKDEFLAFLGQVGKHGFLVLRQNLCADGKFQRDMVAGRAESVTARAGPARLRLEMLLVSVVDQRIQTGYRARDHIAAAAAIAAVGPAERHMRLAPETDGARAAMSRSDKDLGLIQKLHCHVRQRVVTPWRSMAGGWPRGKRGRQSKRGQRYRHPLGRAAVTGARCLCNRKPIRQPRRLAARSRTCDRQTSP